MLGKVTLNQQLDIKGIKQVVPQYRREKSELQRCNLPNFY